MKQISPSISALREATPALAQRADGTAQTLHFNAAGELAIFFTAPVQWQCAACFGLLTLCLNTPCAYVRLLLECLYLHYCLFPNRHCSLKPVPGTSLPSRATLQTQLRYLQQESTVGGCACRASFATSKIQRALLSQPFWLEAASVRTSQPGRPAAHRLLFLRGRYEAVEREARALRQPYEGLARLLNCDPEEVAILQSATAAWTQACRRLRPTPHPLSMLVSAAAVELRPRHAAAIAH